MDTIRLEKFLYNTVWRTGRICSNCGLWEYSKDGMEELKVWMTEPRGCYYSQEVGHTFRYPYQHEIDARETFVREFLDSEVKDG